MLHVSDISGTDMSRLACPLVPLVLDGIACLEHVLLRLSRAIAVEIDGFVGGFRCSIGNKSDVVCGGQILVPGLKLNIDSFLLASHSFILSKSSLRYSGVNPCVSRM